MRFYVEDDENMSSFIQFVKALHVAMAEANVSGKGFLYLQTPIITGSDAEGAGELFHVTGFDLANPKKNEDGSINYNEDFFGKATNLTVSGQLEAELALRFQQLTAAVMAKAKAM